MERYIQDHIMEFHFLYQGEKCKAIFANPIFDEECNFQTPQWIGAMVVSEIIESAYEAYDITTGQTIAYNQ